MRRIFIYMAVFCVLVLSTQVALAGPSGGLIIAPKTYDSINIDGNLNEWKLNLFVEENKIVLTRDNGFINSGSIDNDDDFSSVTYALYDDDDLYIAVEVTDDATENSYIEGNNWQNDCIEIWIDGAGDDGTMTDTGGNDPDNYQFNVDVNGAPYIYRNNDASNLLALMETAATMQGTNYTLEIRIPFEAIPELDLDANRIMGFSVSFVDSDDGVWNHILWQGETENQPAEWGDLEFSLETLSVEPVSKLSTTWGLMKSK
jgi:hypothetical protein